MCSHISDTETLGRLKEVDPEIQVSQSSKLSWATYGRKIKGCNIFSNWKVGEEEGKSLGLLLLSPPQIWPHNAFHGRNDKFLHTTQ